MHGTRIVATLGLLAFVSVTLAARMWDWVLNFDPRIGAAHTPIATGSPLTSSVTILLIDGLRLDASRGMTALNELRARGADIEAQVGTPSFSRPGRATIIAGAPPSVHGVTSNRQKRELTVDHLIRRVAEAGGRCRIFGSGIWPGLAGSDIAKCGESRVGEGKEGPGAFTRQVPEIRAWQKEALDFVLAEPAMLRIVDIVSTDFAAHEYGGASSEYKAEVARAGEEVAELVRRLDLTKETLVIVADHGHRDVGGHGGDEAEVLAIPAVMAGAGVKPGVTVRGQQADIAPTIAALLGLPLPASSSGHALEKVIQADAEKAATVHVAIDQQRRAFEQSVRSRLEIVPDHEGWMEVVSAARERETSRRVPWALVGIASIAAFALLLLRLERFSYLSIVAILAVAGLVTAATSFFNQALSFSAINYDQMLLPYFGRIMMVASCGAIVAIVVSAIAVRRGLRGTPSAAVTAGASGLTVAFGLLGAFVSWWWRFDLLMPTTLPSPGRLVEAYALLLSLFAVSATTLLVMAVVAVANRSRPA